MAPVASTLCVQPGDRPGEHVGWQFRAGRRGTDLVFGHNALNMLASPCRGIARQVLWRFCN